MNENPEGTPNPLNPNLVNEKSSTPKATDSSRPMRATINTAPHNAFGKIQDVHTATSAPSETPTLDANPSEVVRPESVNMQPGSESTDLMTTIESLDPTNRPMEQRVEPAKPKKKTGLIVGIIMLVLVLVGGGVAAALVLLNQQKPDVVAEAMQKIMNGNGPENVAIAGTIDIAVQNEASPITNLKIDLNSEAATSSLINTSKASITATFGETGEFKTDFDEVYAANGDLYFKIEGASATLDELQNSTVTNLPSGTTVETNCVEDENGTTNCGTEVEVTDCDSADGCTTTVESSVDSESAINPSYLNAMMGVINAIDGQWLRISTDELGLISNNALSNSNISCLANMMSNINSSSYSIAEAYSKTPFVVSSSENIPIVSKGNPVYKVNINSANLASFIDAIKNSILVKDLYSCLGWNSNVAINEDNLNKLVNNLPTLYVEIDENYNFTRLYLDTVIEENPATIDLSFSYPANVNVSEPLEYQDFSNVIQEIFVNMYSLPGTEIDTQTTVVE